MSDMIESAPSDARAPAAPSVSRPDEGPGGPERCSQGRSARPGAKQPIESAEDCLAALGRLPALNMLGVLSEKQINAFKGVYSTMLQYYQRQQATPRSANLEEAGILEALRRNPMLANLLEPVLSQEQIDSLMAQARDEPPAGGPAKR